MDALSYSLCFDTTSWHIALPSGVSGIHPISGNYATEKKGGNTGEVRSPA
jgi:hypothetical protein